MRVNSSAPAFPRPANRSDNFVKPETSANTTVPDIVQQRLGCGRRRVAGRYGENLLVMGLATPHADAVPHSFIDNYGRNCEDRMTNCSVGRTKWSRLTVDESGPWRSSAPCGRGTDGGRPGG